MNLEASALAAIGRDQHLLVLRRPGAEQWSLPGTADVPRLGAQHRAAGVVRDDRR
jgi:hypothetical protein